jgi:hypothetical protein
MSRAAIFPARALPDRQKELRKPQAEKQLPKAKKQFCD